MKLSILQQHPCPECFGNVRWTARSCPHCGAEISHTNRFEWLSQAAQAGFFLGLTVLVVMAGAGLLVLAASIGLL